MISSTITAQTEDCPKFSGFTELAFQVEDKDTIYYHEFNKKRFDSVFVEEFRNELDYLLINYSSFSDPIRLDTASIGFARAFESVLEEVKPNDLLCALYDGFTGKFKKKAISWGEVMEAAAQVFYADDSVKRICLRVDGAYPLANPFLDAFCVATILLDINSIDKYPSYYSDFVEATEMNTFNRAIKSNKELEFALLQRYELLKSKLTFKIE